MTEDNLINSDDFCQIDVTKKNALNMGFMGISCLMECQSTII